MVAYNLMLSVFPLALVALFVAGRILESEDVEASVVEDLQRLFPDAAESTLLDGLRPRARVLDDRRDRRRRRRDVVLGLVLGRARHRLLPHLPPRVPLLGAAEAVRPRDAGGRAAVLRRQREHPRATGLRDPRQHGSAVRSRRRARRRLRDHARRQPGAVVRDPLPRLLARAARSDRVALRVAGRGRRARRDGDRRLRLPALPLQRHGAAHRDLVRVRPDRARVVLRARADPARRGGAERAALRTVRTGSDRTQDPERQAAQAD